eukprot:310381-Prymnesium_polylepis.1
MLRGVENHFDGPGSMPRWSGFHALRLKDPFTRREIHSCPLSTVGAHKRSMRVATVAHSRVYPRAVLPFIKQWMSANPSPDRVCSSFEA